MFGVGRCGWFRIVISGLLFPYYGWLKEPLQEDVWRDGVAFHTDACQHVCCLVIIPGYMVEFESFEPG